MSSHLKLKPLLFYGGAIGFVVILFQFTTAYGEATLKAPPNLNGRYLSERSLPGCPESTRLALTIQQSGIYLNGSLLLVEANAPQPTAEIKGTTAEEKPSLKGLWQQQQIVLAGATNTLAGCRFGSNTAPSPPPLAKISLQGQINQPSVKTLTGQITIADNPPVPFIAQHQIPEKSKSAEH